MASRSSCRHLLLAGMVVVAMLAATAAAARSPGYCVPGLGFPRSPELLPYCRWYVLSQRPCSGDVVPLLPIEFMKNMCCRQLGQIPAECRCKALRVMMQARLRPFPPATEEERCRAEQGDFAASLVTEAECGLNTVHGRPYCDVLAAED